MPPTLEDIAKQTRTSISTVSRVLSGGRAAHRISAETRERVLAASKALGYRPNLLARGLRTRKSQTVALLISDIGNPFFAQVASMIERLLHAQGYSLVLCNSGGDVERETEYLELLPQKAIDGLILVPIARTKKALMEALPEHLPVVVLDRPIPGVEATVSSDHDHMATILCDTLERVGVRSVAVACGPQYIFTHRRRCELVSKRFNVIDTHEGRAQRETGRAAWQKFKPELPDAIVCTNNFLAMGVMEEIREPETAPIIAVFDEIPIMHLLPVPLVGIRQDIPLLAEGAVKQLMLQLNGDEGTPEPITLDSQVIMNRAFHLRHSFVRHSSR
ncbi:MAG TPA: LacI family DNA-binding transcriptional regulator [Tepidisphaeraceae bacterium]|jgi:LacI family transcriptional regulator